MKRTRLSAALLAATMLPAASSAQAVILRLMPRPGCAPEEVTLKFEQKSSGIKVQVALSNDEERIAKLRATGGAALLALASVVVRRDRDGRR